jgi:ubiquinone/menaquinone biosynthesis C-methylase UbiE
MKAFDFRLELQFLKVQEGQKILDAGCGSGIVSNYLSTLCSGVSVVGWDFSGDRIAAAQAKYGLANNIHFAQKNLLEMYKESDLCKSGCFDIAVCRFVLRHFNSANGRRVVKNLFNVLKPGGTLYCIDVEGVLNDVFYASPFLKKCLRRLREVKAMDFKVARKMPLLMLEEGFQNVDWHVLTCEFKGDELLQEIDNLQQSFKNAEAFGVKTLGGMKNFARFQKEYFSALQKQGCVHYYNKVIALGSKPKVDLRLITNSPVARVSKRG